MACLLVIQNDIEAVCLLMPIIFIFISGLLSRHPKESRRGFKVCIDLLCLSAQATGFFIWPIVEIGKYLAHVIEQPIFRIPNLKYLERNFFNDSENKF